jgi:hypothetical protein
LIFEIASKWYDQGCPTIQNPICSSQSVSSMRNTLTIRCYNVKDAKRKIFEVSLHWVKDLEYKRLHFHDEDFVASFAMRARV